MDSFYFCFISITTVGFGDFVPKHDPWHIMVTCYTAVGIGITTMCIDLVGTRYITKLHYFGRKLRGGDLMRYLRRKRIRDSKILLAARAAETIEAYLKNFDRSGREESALMILSEPEFIDKGGHDTIEKTEIALTINLPVTVQHAEKVINKNFVCSMHSIQGDLEVRHESSILGNTHAKDRENTYTMQLFPLVPLTDSGSKSSLSSVRDSCESPNDQLKREMIRNYALAQLAGLPSGTAAKSLPNILPLLPISLHERQWKSCQASLEDNVLPQTEQPKLHIDVGPEIGNEYDDSALSTPSGQNMSPLNNNEGEDELLTSTISQRLTECSLPTLSPDGDQLGQKKFSMPDLDSPSEWPTKLRKNMTFMLEGSSLKHGYVAKSSSNWTWHTYPAKYYFSNDMKVFERVNVTFAKKELVNARLLKLPAYPWQVVGTDILSFRDKDYLVVVDYYSRYIELWLLPDKTTRTVFNFMKSMFSRHGMSETIRCDNGPCYSAFEFSQLVKAYLFQLITSSPQYS
uniref:Integrase catalytic domain-containing protein n=1 Tax=Trichuris muris TaxID=70415 RepID=A0A5S6Q5K4_TRIMR